jgi:hypothetical protein
MSSQVGISCHVGATKLRASHRVAVWVAVLGTASAFASPAVAETPPVPAVPELPDATVIVAAALTAAQPVVTPTPVPALPAPAPAVTSTLPPVPPQPESVPPADPATAAPIEQVTTEPVEAPPATPIETPAEAPAPLPDPPATPVAASVPETVAESLEPVQQAVQQVQPVNVNISVRVDSPGDNDAVTQINAALSEGLPVATPPGARYQEPDPQYQDPLAAGEGSVAPAAPADPLPAADAPMTPVDSWDWTWTWTCGDVMTPTIVLPAEYRQQIWNWNWNWNCGANTNANGNSGSQSSSQYQPVTSQYQPINVNISIRIASPGNDGPVAQTNLALAMPVVVQTASNRPVLLPVQWLPAPLASVQTPVASVEISVAPGEIAAWFFETPSAPAQDSASGEGPISETAGNGATVIRSLLQPAPDRGRGDATAGTTGSASVAVSAAQIAALAPPAPAVAAGLRAKAQEQRPTTHARPILPQGAGVAAVSYASVGPLGAGGSDRTLLLIFLISVPFLLAFADAARRVVEEWKAEAADSGRRREKPG